MNKYKLICNYANCDEIKLIEIEDTELFPFINAHDWTYLSHLSFYEINIICSSHKETKGCRKIICQCRT